MAAKRIMVVDDELHIRRVVELKLQSAGYNVRSAVNVKAGLEAIQSFLPNLIVSDYRMPGGLTGIDLVRAVRGFVGLADVPIILLSGSVAVIEELERSIPKNTNTVLMSKPFSPRRLISEVERLLGETPQEANHASPAP